MAEKSKIVREESDKSLETAICAERVTKAFGVGKDKVLALDDVSVTIQKNEFFTLLGPSGCGKTTLLRLIAGFDHPTEGVIKLNGQDISHLPPYQRSINTVFQSYALFPHMTVAQNISFGLEMLGKTKSLVNETVREMLALVKMEDLRKRYTDQISGGQQQRVALARALAPKPEVLLLDEPLAALDYKLRKEMQIELKRLQHETGITFIFVTHDQEEALTMSDRIAVMDAGRILQIGTPRQIYNHPREGFPVWMDNVIVLKTSKNIDNAKLFMNFIMEPENAALISSFARYANGIVGSEKFMPEDMKTAPEIIVPDEFKNAGVFLPACSKEANDYYTAIWTELTK